MEIEDCDFKNIGNISICSDTEDAFRDQDLIILAGAHPRRPGMKRKDLLDRNVHLIRDTAIKINAIYRPDMRILIVANPCNTLGLIFSEYADWFKKE